MEPVLNQNSVMDTASIFILKLEVLKIMSAFNPHGIFSRIPHI